MLFLVVIVIVLFVVVQVDAVFCEIEHGAGFGEVEALGGGVDGADYFGGVGLEVEMGGVDGGELEAVEEGGGAAGFELAEGQGVDDYGEGGLDGLAVFEGEELDVLAGDDVAGGFSLGAEGGVALVEAVVEVAVGGLAERWGLALESVGADVAAELVLHFGAFLGGPPWGLAVKSPMVAIDSEIGLAKYMQPCGLRLNSAKQKT
jgi:hypothetical protein